MDMRPTDIFFKISNPSQTMLIYVFCKICESEIVFYYKCKRKNNFSFVTLTSKKSNRHIALEKLKKISFSFSCTKSLN